jgi:restriction system protein
VLEAIGGGGGLAIIAGLSCILGALAAARRRRLRGSSAVVGRHRRYLAKGERVRAALAEIGPRENPGACIVYLRKIPPLAFEELILSELRDRGHSIRRSPRYSGDGGVDGEFDLGGRLWIVQAKRYAKSVRPEHVRAFDAVCRRRGARGLFVHTGRTGPSSKQAEDASGYVRVLSGRTLISFVCGDEIQLARSSTLNSKPPE